ncbi:hypothetical protein J4453_03100 [Candidatus Woesearchaeota archaeon]|nr:hypothetical protein [Candidatus Woesearchaeota archaeon]
MKLCEVESVFVKEVILSKSKPGTSAYVQIEEMSVFRETLIIFEVIVEAFIGETEVIRALEHALFEV